MKILTMKSLANEAIKVIRFARFRDHRGYFTEHYRHGDFENNETVSFMKGVVFLQCNESCSMKGTVRGLHFQWNPFMGKMVRTIQGRMIDMVLDIRKGSPSFGQIILYDMPSRLTDEYQEWIWVPPGFAHGNIFTEDTVIEYLCSGEYSQGCEAGISPISPDIDWSYCDPELRKTFIDIIENNPQITEKDRNGLSVKAWKEDARSDNFIFGKC